MNSESITKSAFAFVGFLFIISLVMPVRALAETFSIAVLPDTQFLSELSPQVFQAQTRWIVDHRVEENIIYVAHLGDLKDGNCAIAPDPDPAAPIRDEWDEVSFAMGFLEDPITTGLPEGIPYGVLPGNHDFDQLGGRRCPSGDDPRTSVRYNQEFGPGRFLGRSYYGGSYDPTPADPTDNNNDNNYTLFNFNGIEFIAINLAYREISGPLQGEPGNEPTALLQWANELLQNNPGKLGIVTSHSILDVNRGQNPSDPPFPPPFSDYGQEIYNALMGNPNLFLMLGGHDRGEAWRTETRIGMDPVHVIMSNYQHILYPTTDPVDFGNLPIAPGSVAMGDSGFMRLMQFDTDTRMVNVRTFSPALLPEPLPIVDASVPVQDAASVNLFDGDLATAWNNDGNVANTWFEVVLETPRELTQLRLAPRVDRAYTFNVYVDGNVVGQYTTTSAATVALQTFALPADTIGSVVRIEAVSHNWFRVHEVELLGESAPELPIVAARVGARSGARGRLFDGDLATAWFNDGNLATAWFEVDLNLPRELTQLKLAPRDNRAYTFDVSVDGNPVAQYTTASTDTVALQTFVLPPGTFGSVVRVQFVSGSWFRVHEVGLLGQATTMSRPDDLVSNRVVEDGSTMTSQTASNFSFPLPTTNVPLSIVDANVSVNNSNSARLFDGDLETAWFNDGNLATAQFDVVLDAASEIRQLKLAPRTNRAYTFDVYVDDVFVDQYTTASTDAVALQTFVLPAGTVGTVLRVQLASGSWFRVHEVALLGETASAHPIPIVDASVPTRNGVRDRLFDGDLATFWYNDGNLATAWFAVQLDVAREITQLNLAPRTDRAYTFNVYVDDVFVDQFTTASTNAVTLQTFALPAGTFGTVVRVELDSGDWFRVHEVELLGN